MRKLFFFCNNHIARKALRKLALHTGAVMLFAAAASQAAAEVKVYAYIGQKKNNYDTAPYISGQEFATALEAAAATDAPEVTVSINSGGGSVTHGYMCISAMQKSAKPVTAVIDGYAASMGYYMCLGAGKILASKNSIIMLHSVQGAAAGSPEDLIAEAEALKTFNATIATLLAARTGLTEEEVTAQYLGKEVYLTAQQALEPKLIHGITDYTSANVPDVTASMTYAEANERFTAMLQTTTETGFIEKVAAAVKKLFNKPEPKAMLTEVEENKLSYILYSTRCAADEAYESMEYIAAPEIKALMQRIYDANASFTVAIVNALYGDNLTSDQVTAKAKEVSDRLAQEKTGALHTSAIEAAKKVAATELAQVNSALAEAKAEVQRLAAENETLKQQPAEKSTKVAVKKDNSTTAAGLAEVDDSLLTSWDRERIARRQREMDNE